MTARLAASARLPFGRALAPAAALRRGFARRADGERPCGPRFRPSKASGFGRLEPIGLRRGHRIPRWRKTEDRLDRRGIVHLG